MKKKIIKEWLQITAGLSIFSFGVYLTIWANIGLAPWDCLGMGLSYHTPMNYGVSMTVMAVVIMGIDLLLRERIGFGTIIDSLLTGNLVQLFSSINTLPENHNVLLGVVVMLIGFVFMALGMRIYMAGAQCCGPRDSLLVGLGKRMPSVPIGAVEIILWSVVLLAGWLLGGPIGIGTLISTFGAGAVMHLIYSLLKFEPRAIRHRDVIEVMRELAADNSRD